MSFFSIKKPLILLCFLGLTSSFSYSQKLELSTFFIADSLKLNANAVVRLNQIDIVISSQRNMTVKNKRIITIFNEHGLDVINGVEHYDKRTHVNYIDATIYNAFGTKIKNLKEKDFKDHIAVDGVTLFSDSRVKYLEYTPTEYPFTILYESEIQTSNTALIPRWMPLNDYYVGIEKSSITVNYPSDLGFKKKELNFEKYPFEK